MLELQRVSLRTPGIRQDNRQNSQVVKAFHHARDVHLCSYVDENVERPTGDVRDPLRRVLGFNADYEFQVPSEEKENAHTSRVA